MSRMRRNGVRGLLAMGALSGLVGCSGVPKADYDAALTEAATLRQQLEQTERDLEACQSSRSNLASELASAQGEIDRLIESGQTGFESIEGTSVSGRPGAIAVNVEGDVLFASGSIDLKQNAKQTLDKIASVISDRYSGKQIRIEGHTDSDPIRRSDWETNERLSFERANAVEEYLASNGLDSDAMYTAAFGPSVPKATKAESRRVEIVIIE